MTKDELRLEMKRLRRQITKEESEQKSRAAADAVFELPQYKSAETVMAYMASFKEISTSAIIRDALKHKRLVIPVSNTDSFTITPSYLKSENELVKGAYGIYEPRIIEPAEVNDIDIAFIPGIAFDRRGGRLGFGKGYYDRFLSEFHGVKIGFCYEFQLIDTLPLDSHDIPMDIIITEKRIYNDF